MPGKKMSREVLSWVMHIGLAVVIGFLITNFVIQRTVVYSCSMEPTLYEGDSLWVEKVSPKLGSIHRGDIVTIYAPEVVEQKDHSLIKRVIAVEDDLVEIKDGKVFVNGGEVKEDYIKGSYTLQELPEYSSLTVPKDQVYVLGDNRDERIVDSRTMGPIDVSRINGKAIFRIYPFSRLGLLNS